MVSGLLRVTGSVSLSQFWPTGTSDADTTKVKVSGAGHKFEFRPNASSPFKVTHAFDGAIVHGATRKDAIDQKKGEITVRWQGIDAPELHYRPPALLRKKQQTSTQHKLYLQWNEEYRQPLGETATVELGKLLGQIGTDPVPCRVETQVDDPSEVFDTYGRLIGDILVTIGGKDVNLNHWLAENGWAFPTFYASMTESEIAALTDLANAAYAADLGIWANDEDYAKNLDFQLIYPPKGTSFDPKTDTGPVFMPKIFRRLSTWAVNKKAKMATGTFPAYLKAHPDHCYLTDDFLLQGPTASTPRRLDEFVESDGFISVWPEQLVFQEKPSDVTSPGGAAVVW